MENTNNIPTRQIPVRQQTQEQPSIQEKPIERTFFKTYIEEAMDNSQLELIPFVEKQIELMNNKLLFSGETPSFEALNTKLLEYEGVLLGLTSLYEMKRWDVSVKKEVYDEWYARRYIEIRDQVNPANMSASKWLSAKEIEQIIISRYGDERAKIIADLRQAESEKSTVERLIEGWKSYQFCLSTISSNARAELQASGISIDEAYDESD